MLKQICYDGVHQSSSPLACLTVISKISNETRTFLFLITNGDPGVCLKDLSALYIVNHVSSISQ